MIEVGKIQSLHVDSEDQSGFYLTCSDEREVFMPGTLAPTGLKTGAMVDVFVFIDSKGDEIATGTMPLAQVDEFACLRVKEVTDHGAFLDLGAPKDLLVPKKFQKYLMKKGEVHLVRVMKEEGENCRLYGTSKIGDYIETKDIKVHKSQIVSIIPYHRTPLGFKILVEKKYTGMVYHNEIFSDVEIGKTYEGAVKSLRPDGQVDCLLKKVGLKGVKDAAEIILDAIEANGGRLDIGDKSSPEQIKDQLGMSKKAFKAAVGVLYKNGKVQPNSDNIVLMEQKK